MSFAREGLVFVAIAALIAAGTYALALNRRSWTLWLLAFAFTVIALCVAYFFRDPARGGTRSDGVVLAPRVHVFPLLRAPMMGRLGPTTLAGTTKIAELVTS